MIFLFQISYIILNIASVCTGKSFCKEATHVPKDTTKESLVSQKLKVLSSIHIH